MLVCLQQIYTDQMESAERKYEVEEMPKECLELLDEESEDKGCNDSSDN